MKSLKSEEILSNIMQGRIKIVNCTDPGNYGVASA